MDSFTVYLPQTFLIIYLILGAKASSMDDTSTPQSCVCCARGDLGSQGPTGMPGIQGLPGMPGAPGSHGTNGVPGLHGSKGDSGYNGVNGPQGPPGDPGLVGLPGKIGPRGPRGHSGQNGEDGRPGQKGEPSYWEGSSYGPYHVHSQSAFSVACSKEILAPPIDDTILPFDTVFTNVGNDFDSAQGVFHCRINGTYYFVIHANKWSNQNDLFLKLMKNGQIMIGLYEDAGYDYYDVTSNSLLLHLVEGDQVWLQLHTNNRVYGGSSRMTTFSGWLIYEDPIS